MNDLERNPGQLFQTENPTIFYNFAMSEVYFFHSILSARKNELNSKIKRFFHSSNYCIFITPAVSLYAYEREVFKFYWRLRPIEINYEQLDLTSEVLIDSQKVKSSTEIRIVFSDHILLEHYFEQLVYQLLDCFSIIEGKKLLPELDQEPKFASLTEYNKYRFLRDRRVESEYQLAMKQIISSEKLAIHSTESNKHLVGLSVREYEKRHRGSKPMFSLQKQLEMVRGWDDLGQIDNQMDIKEYLIKTVGPLSERDLQEPYISPATFYSIRRRLIENELFTPTPKKRDGKRIRTKKK